jgi:hypothetical protein
MSLEAHGGASHGTPDDDIGRGAELREVAELEQEYDDILRQQHAEVAEYVAEHAPMLAHYEVHHADFHLPLRPMLLTRAQVHHLESSVRLLWGGLLSVYERVFGGDLEKIVDFLQTPRPLLPWLERCFAPERSVDELFGRPDGFLWGRHVKLIEQNITSGPGGLAATGALVRFFDGFPVLAELGKRHVIARMSPIERYAAYFTSPELAGKNIGYIDAIDPGTGQLYDLQGLRFLEDLKALGVELAYLTSADTVVDQDGIRLGSQRIHCLYRGVAAIGILERTGELGPWFDACGRGVAELISSPYEILFFDKRLLPYLSDERLNDFLDERDRMAMPEILPWTRFLRDGDAEFRGEQWSIPALCVRYQDDLVIKKGDGFGSNAVVIGAEHSADEWSTHVARALADGSWIVQEMVTPPRVSLPFLENGALVWTDVLAMTCPYMIQGRIGGIAGRTSVPSGSRVLVGAGVKGSQSGIRTAFCLG